MQFSTFQFKTAEETVRIAARSMVDLPSERIAEEWKKLIIKATINTGLNFLKNTDDAKFSELNALINCKQDPNGIRRVCGCILYTVDAFARERLETSGKTW